MTIVIIIINSNHTRKCGNVSVTVVSMHFESANISCVYGSDSRQSSNNQLIRIATVTFWRIFNRFMIAEVLGNY